MRASRHGGALEKIPRFPMDWACYGVGDWELVISRWIIEGLVQDVCNCIRVVMSKAMSRTRAYAIQFGHRVCGRDASMNNLDLDSGRSRS